MGYGNEVDSVGAEVRAGLELNGTFEHAEEEIVCGSYSGSFVPRDVARADDTATEASRAGFADEVFGDVLRLGVPC